jgi:hypothetical protein
LILSTHCHNWFNLLKYGIMCIIHDNACNDNCCSRKNIIIHWVFIQRWFHSSCYKDLWLFSFSFQLLFFVLCLGHYSLLVAIFFNSHDAYSFIIHSVCTLSSSVHMTLQFLMFCCIWETLFISSTYHISQPMHHHH